MQKGERNRSSSMKENSGKRIGIIRRKLTGKIISIIPIRFLTLLPGKRFSEGIPFFYFLDFCGGYK